jgi:isocitrate dehydrogenase
VRGRAAAYGRVHDCEVAMAEGYERIRVPSDGERIQVSNGEVKTPARPIIPFIEGDGTGPDIWRATRHVLEGAVKVAYGDARRIVWMEVYAGEKAKNETGEWLPAETLRALQEFKVGIKGPLTTPVGGGIRSLNVTLRQVLDLFACIRPVRYFKGVPSPMQEPGRLDVVIFRENTEDVYAGIEWKAGSEEANRLIELLHSQFRTDIRAGSAIGIKPMSAFGSKRLVRSAIRYALQRERNSVTLVHKGNIMKYTEGAFRDWGYELAREEFGDRTVPESEAGAGSDGRVVIKDRIADAMFQQILLRPDEYSVLAMPNLNGDYMSDAAAAQVGGLGMAPGANVGEEVAVFEATHGTAPKYANQDKVNPGSLVLSGVMMLEYMGWNEAAESVIRGLGRTIENGTVTYDLERQMKGATLLSTSKFGEAIVANM